ncbi:MAG: hypothetical protein AB1486_26630 [Planctomycetota bacterium]
MLSSLACLLILGTTIHGPCAPCSDQQVVAVLVQLGAGLLQDDPESAAQQAEARFRSHRYFSRVPLRRDHSNRDLVCFEQQVADSGDADVTLYAVPLADFATAFRQALTATLPHDSPLPRRVPVVAVLANAAEYDDYCRVSGLGGPATVGAQYNPSLRLAVFHREPEAARSDAEIRAGARFALTHALLDAAGKGDAESMRHYWLREGLARYFERWSEEVARDLKLTRVDQADLASFATMMRDPDKRRAYFFPVRELLAAKGRSDVIQTVARHASGLAAKDPDWKARGYDLFQIQTCLFTVFMLASENIVYRQAVLESLLELVADPNAKLTTRTALRQIDRDKLHEAYVRSVASQLKSQSPQLTLSEDIVAELVSKPKAASGAAEKEKTLAEAFKPALLRVEIDAKVVLGRALRKARDGGVESAIQGIDEYTAAHPAEDTAHLQREGERLRALVSFRKALIERLAREKKKIRVTFEGSSETGEPELVDEATLRLKQGSKKTITVAISAMSAADLVWSLRSGKLQNLGPEWVKAYAAFLAGDEKWEKMAKGDGDELALLRRDLPFLEQCLRAAEIDATLTRLAETPLPSSAAEARPLVETIEKLFKSHAGDPLLEARRQALEQFAALGLARLFDLAPPQEATSLGAKIVPLPDGRHRLTWTFDQATELRGFEEAAYMPWERARFPELVSYREKALWEVSGGKLTIAGAVCRRLDAELEAPLEVSFDLVYSAKGFEHADLLPQGMFFVGLCHDRQGNCIRCFGLGNLQVSDSRTRLFETAKGEEGVLADEVYRITIVHDGKTVQTFVDGEPRQSLPCGTLQKGEIFLWLQYDATILLDNLQIEGRLTSEYLDLCRERWVQGELAKLVSKPGR